jgi:Flp pilus assembly protein TadB
MTVLLALFKRLKLETVLFCLLAIMLVVALAYGAWQHQKVKTAETDLAVADLARKTAELTLADTQAQMKDQLTNIKTLETARQDNQAAIDPFILRLDDLFTQDASNAQGSVVDRLNALNADTNRMLEQSSR